MTSMRLRVMPREKQYLAKKAELVSTVWEGKLVCIYMYVVSDMLEILLYVLLTYLTTKNLISNDQARGGVDRPLAALLSHCC
jgi:hypothetical protein